MHGYTWFIHGYIYTVIHVVGYTWLYMVFSQCLKLLVGNFKLCIKLWISKSGGFEIIDLENCMKLKCIGKPMPFNHAVMQTKDFSSLSLSFGLTFYFSEKKDALHGCIKGCVFCWCSLSQFTALGDVWITYWIIHTVTYLGRVNP